MKRLTTKLVIALSAITANTQAQTPVWPDVKTEMKPGTRWWWMGNAVDSVSLSYNLSEYAKAGMGSVEITPIYGVQNNEKNDIDYLSDRWMNMYKYTVEQNAKNGMLTDMNNGTGWPFGGPATSIEDAACRLLISEYKVEGRKINLKIEVSDAKQKPYAKLERVMAFSAYGNIRLDITTNVDANGILSWKAPKKGEWRIIAAFCGKTLQKVKRAAPGGEGFVIDHFSKDAVSHYFDRFNNAFSNTGANWPHNFFNDSYEVYKADWTTGLFDEFEKSRGYKLELFLPEFLDEGHNDTTARVISDYRETLAELLHKNFTQQWTDWAHSNGSLTRSQAHGSPGNLIDLYATVDVPECEGFGLSDFKIKGLRKDSLTRKNDSDLSMLKYASSAAHITGKQLTSSETFTWLTEHFRTSLSQCKPDLDLMFVSGVNHVFFHGTTYSPKDAPWPGWKFYASIDMSPTNSIWKAAPDFFTYITRCQSFLQSGKPDNDFLLYLPIYDLWHEQQGRLMMFEINKMDKYAPRFIKAVNRISEAGYDVDYISDDFIKATTCSDGMIVTSGGASYKALIIPGARLMPESVIAKLASLAKEGATIVFLDRYPEDIPGNSNIEARRLVFQKHLAEIKNCNNVIYGTDYDATLAKTTARPEEIRKRLGLSCIRRSNDEGFHYFISALTDKDTECWIPLGVNAKSVVAYNPMNGKAGKARTRQNNGNTEVFMQLASGESIILKTYTNKDITADDYPAYEPTGKELEIGDEWFFQFDESIPKVTNAPTKVRLGSWTELNALQAKNTMATARYSTTIDVDMQGEEYLLSLGDVRESARITINGKQVCTLWAVPYNCYIGEYLHKGKNTIEIEVTNLPANRIAEMDRQGIEWRKFKDINIAKLNYKKGTYAHWPAVESGLLGPVTIKEMKTIK